MKKKLPVLFLGSSLLLSACFGQNEKETLDNKPEETEESTETSTTEDSKDQDSKKSKEEKEEITFKYKINPDLFSVEPIDDTTDEKLVLLTFDDAPYGNSLQIAQALEERGVSAIFFVNGMYLEDEEGLEIVRTLHEKGFEIGNHTHTHPNLSEISEEAVREEIEKTNLLIEQATGKRPRFFRPPFGIMSEAAYAKVAEDKMTFMNWSFGYDWMDEHQNASSLTNITLNAPELSPGANILMHDRTWTAEAIPDIVDGLIAQGYTIADPKLITND